MATSLLPLMHLKAKTKTALKAKFPNIDLIQNLVTKIKVIVSLFL